MRDPEECSGCRFWYPDGDLSPWGDCRPRAPEIAEDADRRWGRSHASEGCGEFEASAPGRIGFRIVGEEETEP